MSSNPDKMPADKACDLIFNMSLAQHDVSTGKRLFQSIDAVNAAATSLFAELVGRMPTVLELSRCHI